MYICDCLERVRVDIEERDGGEKREGERGIYTFSIIKNHQASFSVPSQESLALGLQSQPLSKICSLALHIWTVDATEMWLFQASLSHPV